MTNIRNRPAPPRRHIFRAPARPPGAARRPPPAAVGAFGRRRKPAWRLAFASSRNVCLGVQDKGPPPKKIASAPLARKLYGLGCVGECATLSTPAPVLVWSTRATRSACLHHATGKIRRASPGASFCAGCRGRLAGRPAGTLPPRPQGFSASGTAPGGKVRTPPAPRPVGHRVAPQRCPVNQDDNLIGLGLTTISTIFALAGFSFPQFSSVV